MYESFAQVYDTFMDNVPYDEWAGCIIEKLKEADIPSGTYYPVPLHLQGAFAKLGYREGDLPVTENLSKNSFVLPVFPELYDEERDYIIHTLKEILK